MRKKQNSTVQEHFRKIAALPKAISVITYGELLYGAKNILELGCNRQKLQFLKNSLSDIVA